MLKNDELKVLKVLFNDLTKEHTIQSISLELKQKYPQTYHTIHNMQKNGDVIIKKIGNYKIVKLDFTKLNYNYVIAEIERANYIISRNIYVKMIKEDLKKINKNFICILFGSQVEKHNPESDVDLLFLIPKEYDYEKFDTLTYNTFIGSVKTDINVAFEESLHNMLAYPEKFNVGNELLKKHIVLYGTEHFLNLLRIHYVGE